MTFLWSPVINSLCCSHPDVSTMLIIRNMRTGQKMITVLNHRLTPPLSPFLPLVHILSKLNLKPSCVWIVHSFLPPPLQPGVAARASGHLLRSAGSGPRPRRPAVVQLHAAGAADPGERPRQSPPGQRRLHGQTAPGGGRGRGGRSSGHR